VNKNLSYEALVFHQIAHPPTHPQKYCIAHTIWYICLIISSLAVIYAEKNSIDPRLRTYNFPWEIFWNYDSVEYACYVISFAVKVEVTVLTETHLSLPFIISPVLNFHHRLIFIHSTERGIETWTESSFTQLRTHTGPHFTAICQLFPANYNFK